MTEHNTGIEWTHIPGTKGETWNPIVGCSLVSPGCTNCYAMKTAFRLERFNNAPPHYHGLAVEAANGKPVWTGKVALAPDKKFTEPLRWKHPRTVFVNSMSDLFHEEVPDEVIDRVFAVMSLCPRHDFQVLTKRSARMRAYCSDTATPIRIARVILDMASSWAISGTSVLSPLGNRADEDDPEFVKWPLLNVWLGVSVEDQRRADERIPDLLATPAAVRLLSAEPLLGLIEFSSVLKGDWLRATYREKAGEPSVRLYPTIDWVIVGGESGPGARPMHPAWARSIRDQCAEARVSFFFKQWGNWMPIEAWSTPLANGRFAHEVAIGSGGRLVPPDVNPDDVGGHRMRLHGSKGWHGSKLLDGVSHAEWPAHVISRLKQESMNAQ